MRIISGKYKGRKIIAPFSIRPTQDKVRKALFDILGDVRGSSFLELFAGSGAVGLEALSRGVADLTLVESNRKCLDAINKNLESLASKACNLLSQEACDAIKTLFSHRRKFDIIFLDPPYHKGPALRLKLRTSESLAKKTLQILEVYDILAPNGFIIIQHFKKDELPKATGKLVLIKESGYGDTLLSFYRAIVL